MIVGSGSVGARRVSVHVGGVRLLLDGSGAAFDPVAGRLFVADLHLGKGSTLRRAGIPIPEGTSRATMSRVSRAVEAAGGEVREVWVLGDLVHAAAGLDATLVSEVSDWISGLPGARLHLVRGNHDRGAGELPSGWALEQHGDPHRIGGLGLAHIPPDPGESTPADGGLLAGHLHPMVRPGQGRTRVPKTPAFIGWGGPPERPAVLVLPAQGRLVDGAVLRGRPGLHAWACAADAVVALPPGRW